MEEWIIKHAKFIAYASQYGKLILYKGCPFNVVKIELFQEGKRFSISPFVEELSTIEVRSDEVSSIITIELK